MSPTVPPAELRILNALCVLAVDMALDGFACEGYVSLVEGLCRARGRASEPWTDELIAQYRRTLDDYADRYDVARE
jgi:hypothetical protein